MTMSEAFTTNELVDKARARAIWAENPASHDDLRNAFKQTQPLVTMSEIEA